MKTHAKESIEQQSPLLLPSYGIAVQLPAELMYALQ
jgi:hypothetical protein